MQTMHPSCPVDTTWQSPTILTWRESKLQKGFFLTDDKVHDDFGLRNRQVQRRRPHQLEPQAPSGETDTERSVTEAPSHLLRLPLSDREASEPSEPW